WCLGLTLDEWRKADHTGVLCVGGIVALHLMVFGEASHAGRRFRRAMECILPFYSMLVVRAYPFSVQSILMLLLFVLVVLAGRFLFHKTPKTTTTPWYDGRYLAAGLVALAIGGCLYFLPDASP